MKQLIRKVCKFISNHEASFTLLGYVVIFTVVLMFVKEGNKTYVEVITVDSHIEDYGETLPTEPMLFDEVEEFIQGKRQIISIDYEVDRDSGDHVIRTAVITYRK